MAVRQVAQPIPSEINFLNEMSVSDFVLLSVFLKSSKLVRIDYLNKL